MEKATRVIIVYSLLACGARSSSEYLYCIPSARGPHVLRRWASHCYQRVRQDLTEKDTVESPFWLHWEGVPIFLSGPTPLKLCVYT